MELSIIIPCYNMETYLPECLDSLYKQGLPETNFEVIVVNDESKDNTLEVAKGYASKHANLNIIDKKNAGVGAARNSGFDKAIGEFIYFLDPDDYIAVAVLPFLLNLIRKHGLDILTFNSFPFKEGQYPNSNNLETVHDELTITDGITYIANRKYKNEIWWFLIRKEFMVQSGIRFIEGKWMEDAILAAQLFLKAQKMAHIELDVHRYRILPTSAMRNKSPEHYRKVIYDNANAAHVFDGLIKDIPSDHPNMAPCAKRLKTRQQSFVFFLLVRLMKSDISVDKIPEMLHDFETIDAYPLKKFIGPDYHGFSYSFMVFIFNNKSLIKPFVKIFRTFYNFVR